MKKAYVLAVCLAIYVVLLLSLAGPVSATHRRQEEEGGNPTKTPTRTITRDPSITSIPLIIGMGQSNMAGKATIISGTGTRTRTPPPGAVMMKWNSSSNSFQWVQMEEPADVWIGYPGNPTPTGTRTPPKNYNYGASSAFVGKLMELTGWDDVAFINCGVGGTSVRDWAPSAPNSNSAPYFNDCWKRITSAQSHYAYEVIGVIIINGENETIDLATAQAYEPAMVDLYVALTTRLQKPRLPVAYYRLAYAPPPCNPPVVTVCMDPPRLAWNYILGIQQSLDDDYDTFNWGPASSYQVTREPIDETGRRGLHYASADDYDRIGVVLAEKFVLLLSSTPLPPTSTPTLTRTPSRTPTPTPP